MKIKLKYNLPEQDTTANSATHTKRTLLMKGKENL